jgi:PAS domain S-box-containing protein
VADPASTWPCGLVETTEDSIVLWVNDAFVEWIGRSRADLEGTHLQTLLAVGSRVLYETQVAPILRLGGVAAELALDLLAADGTRLAALVNVAAGRDGADERRYFAIIGATQRRSYERELVQARRQAEAATAAAEQAQDRLELLAEVNVILSEGLELQPALQRLAELITQRRDCACRIVETPLSVPATAAAARSGTASTATAAGALANTVVSSRLEPDHGQAERGRTSQLQRENRTRGTEAAVGDQLLMERGVTLTVPIRVRETQLGTIVLARAPGEPAFGQADLDEITELAHRIGLHLENTRLSRGEHDRALALQQALLTPAVQTDGLQIATTYLPSADGAMVGGDWYDSLLRPDGTTVLVIGDVTGHDHVAAAAMGQLRGLLRAIAYLSVDTPAGVLSAVDRAAAGLGLNVRATAILAYLSPPDALGRRRLQWANAGHPPPALVSADGPVSWLEMKPDLMLGVRPDWPRQDHHRVFDRGDTLVFYTDGLIENRARDIDTGLDALEEALTRSAGQSVDVLSSEVIDTMATVHQDDDMALLVVRSTGVTT